MSGNEDRLAWAERRIAEGELCCTELRILIAQRTTEGFNTTDAAKMLQDFEATLTVWRRFRQQILGGVDR